MKQEFQEAFNLVSSVCAQISVPLQDHNKIQTALRLIYGELDKPEKKPEKKKAKLNAS